MMYGLLLEAIVDYIIDNYGETKWEQIRKVAKLKHTTFATHEQYNEKIIATIAEVMSEMTGRSFDEIMDAFGVSFVHFVGQYGYDKILRVLGRNMRDFLSGLDNLHEYLRFSYPKLKPPSFFVENETQSGLTLHYRSRRTGYVNYVQGQIRQVGRQFYNTKVTIKVTSEETLNDHIHVVMRLHFDNKAFFESYKNIDHITQSLPLRSDVFFELFPFHIVFNRLLKIGSIGVSMLAVMPFIRGKNLGDVFKLVRPMVPFTWDSIMGHTNNVFEIASLLCVQTRSADTRYIRFEDGEKKDSDKETAENTRGENNRLNLRGQMVFMPDWDAIIFLGTPLMENLESMFRCGLFINDLSMHDSSRDLVLAGTQQSAELKLALDQEQQKSRILEDSVKKLDEEMKRTDSLLYQMIPKPVADRLRSGEQSISTCEVFDCLTIVFTDVVGFTSICSQITPMEVVSMLNAMYTKFDILSEKHSVYKVETIGDAYMGVAGAPERTKYHGVSICNMALDMLVTMADLTNPTSGESMKIRIGIHSGMAVAGVVGVKMPRYCLFGDTVNTASRMETTSMANKIHISETTRNEISSMPYEVEERGTVEVKGKGHMKTYWLLSKTGEVIVPDLPRTSQTPDTNISSINSSVYELRTLYSPVSFDDAQKKISSNMSTPLGSPVKSSPSNTNDIPIITVKSENNIKDNKNLRDISKANGKIEGNSILSEETFPKDGLVNDHKVMGTNNKREQIENRKTLASSQNLVAYTSSRHRDYLKPDGSTKFAGGKSLTVLYNDKNTPSDNTQSDGRSGSLAVINTVHVGGKAPTKLKPVNNAIDLVAIETKLKEESEILEKTDGFKSVETSLREVHSTTDTRNDDCGANTKIKHHDDMDGTRSQTCVVL